MIKIKDYIFNENKIIQICINEMNNLEIDVDNGFPRVIKDANFSDIEWNYEREENTRRTLLKRINELEIENHQLEEENKKLKEENQHIFANVNDDELLRSNAMNWAEKNELQDRIDKAIKYIEVLYTRYIADYSDIERLEKILKGEENESN